MFRMSLADFFADPGAWRGECVVYDDGYHSHVRSYADTTRAARAFARRLSDLFAFRMRSTCGTIFDMGAEDTPFDPTGSPDPALPGPVGDPVVVPPNPLSPAVRRFESCRWRQAAEDGNPAHCTHRDVAPIAGINSFDPDAWCADCRLYKIRRAPRKRQAPPERSYY